MIKDMEQELRYASFTQRWVGCVIDEIVIWSMVYLLYKWFFPTLFFINHPLLCLLGVILLFLVLSYSYYFLLELYFGRTLGKWICRTKVVDDDGNKPSAATIARRELYRMSPWDRLGKPYFLLGAYYDEDGHLTRMHHDAKSRTKVVKI